MGQQIGSYTAFAMGRLVVREIRQKAVFRNGQTGGEGNPAKGCTPDYSLLVKGEGRQESALRDLENTNIPSCFPSLGHL